MVEKILIRVPQDLKQELKEAAKTKGATMNQLILRILWDWDEKQKKEQ